MSVSAFLTFPSSVKLEFCFVHDFVYYPASATLIRCDNSTQYNDEFVGVRHPCG